MSGADESRTRYFPQRSKEVSIPRTFIRPRVQAGVPGRWHLLQWRSVLSDASPEPVDQAGSGSGGVRTHEGLHPYLFSKQAAHRFASLPNGGGILELNQLARGYEPP